MTEYRCFHCNQVFTEERGAREHFGYNVSDIPKCIEYGRTGQGGGIHDPWRRVLKSELAKAEADMILVRQLIEGWRNTCSEAEWGEFDQEALQSAERVHKLLFDLSR